MKKYLLLIPVLLLAIGLSFPKIEDEKCWVDYTDTSNWFTQDQLNALANGAYLTTDGQILDQSLFAPQASPSTPSTDTVTKEEANPPKNDTDKPEEVIPCTHDFVETKRIEPTCTEYGSICYECTICEELKTEEVKPSHSYATGLIIPPTCTKDGYTYDKCTLCGHEIKTADKKAKGHTETEEIKKATLFKDGLKTVTCSTCVELISKDVLPRIIPSWALIFGLTVIFIVAAFIGYKTAKKRH